MAFLEIDGLKKRFGNVEILKGINVELEKGGFLVLVGPSGCGKTTLLKIIGGILEPVAGSCEVMGRELGATDGEARTRHRRPTPYRPSRSRSLRQQQALRRTRAARLHQSRRRAPLHCRPTPYRPRRCCQFEFHRSRRSRLATP